ncbi:hypothetical protein ACFS07_36145 [Undibacterium arcticum]
MKPMLVGQAIIICGDDDVLTQDRITDGLNQLVQKQNQWAITTIWHRENRDSHRWQ